MTMPTYTPNPMRYPLLWKELREARLAIWLGVAATLMAMASAWSVNRQGDLMALFGFGAFQAAVLAVIAVAFVNITLERQHGTWEFLCTQPVDIHRLIAIRWSVAVGISAVLAAMLSAVTWTALRSPDTVAAVGLGTWVAYHASAVALLVSLCVGIDMIDWDRWLRLRVAVTTLVFGVYFYALSWGVGLDSLDPFRSLGPSGMSWGRTAILSMLALLFGAAAVAGAPLVARDSFLPRLAFQFMRHRRRTFTPDSAWLWLQWQTAWPVVVAVGSFVPMIVLLQVAVPLLLGAGNLHSLWSELVRGFGATMPGYLVAAAVAFGLSLPLLDAAGNAASFGWALPYSPSRLYRLRAISRMVLLGLVSLPSLAVCAAGAAAYPDAFAARGLVEFPSHLLASAALFLMLHLVASLLFSIGNLDVSIHPVFGPLLGLLLAAMVVGAFIGVDRVGVLPLPLALALAAAATVISWLAAPHLHRWREI